MPVTPGRRLTHRKWLSPNTDQRLFKGTEEKSRPAEFLFLSPWRCLPTRSKKKQVGAEWVWNAWLDMGEAAKLRFSRSIKCKAEFGVCSLQEGRGGVYAHQVDELQGNTPVDSCHCEIHALKSSEQLCNGTGASFNRPFVQRRHWEAETNPDAHLEQVFPLATPVPSRELGSKFKYGQGS